jgi:glycosyltransferase involved in cell wall biosynthesis
MSSVATVVPTRFNNLIFLAKAQVLKVVRHWQNFWNPQVQRWSVSPANTKDFQDLPIAAESSSQLWVGATAAEWILQAGKIQNLRQALGSIHGLEIPAGEMFSFWAQIGPPRAYRGYVAGRELREGCIIPSIGGGLCQLSNALYDGALQAGLEIVERHAHNQVIPGSLAEIDRDATVFWNYVDLRFRTQSPLRIEAVMDDRSLTVRFHTVSQAVQEMPPVALPLAPANSCLACGVTSCHRQQQPALLAGRTAYLVDDRWPEFDRYIQSTRTARDYLFLPVDGQRVGKANYAWQTAGFAKVQQHRSVLVLRFAQSVLLRIARQGANYQKLLLSQSRYLANIYGRSLTPDTTHLVVTQSLLPHLWRSGHLAGRSFDVLMTAMPMEQLQQRLDQAANCYPHSPTLNNFRVATDLATAEAAALQQARQIITPHAELADLWPHKTQRLDWVLPVVQSFPSASRSSRPTLLLPSASIGRKGIYELRSVLQNLDLQLIIAGGELETPDFWQGYRVTYQPDYRQALSQADIVVAPAWIDHQPRRVLQAIALGIPTICSRACGLPELPNVIQVPIGDPLALEQAIQSLIQKSPSLERLAVEAA